MKRILLAAAAAVAQLGTQGPLEGGREAWAFVGVDIQNDFCPGGALAVADGDKVVAPANRLMALFRAKGLPVCLTRDWHPRDHCSFQPQGGPWPPHCVAGSKGAAFHPGLDVADAVVVSKADTRDKDAYSGFQGTNLAARLRAREVAGLVVAGLATDYCVKDTVLDALAQGFAVLVAPEAIRAVDAQPGDGLRAVEEMRAAGARFLPLDELAALLE